jgi:hypothetical protein
MEEVKYKLYVYDTYSSGLTRLLKTDKTFKTLEEVIVYLSNGNKSVWLSRILSQKQIVVCCKTDRWRIVEVIDPHNEIG